MSSRISSDHLSICCKEAIQFLKKTYRIKPHKTSLVHLPAYLLIGPTSSGKTTVLTQSELKFILEKKNNRTQNTKNYDWWVTSKAVIIDTPGSFFASAQNKRTEHYVPFLHALEQQNYKKQLKGLLVNLSITDLITEPYTLIPFYENIQQQLSHLVDQIGHTLPIILFIQKCDLIAGFQEFFHDLSREERFQIWGFPFAESDNGNRALRFEREFKRLIDRLNHQLIWKLSHEPRIEYRMLINNFPFQMSQLKIYLQPLIDKIFDDMPSLRLEGIFFTSALQPSHSFSTNSTNENQSIKTLIPLNTHNKAFFIHDVFDGWLFNRKEHLPLKKSRQKWMGLSLILLSMSSIFLWGIFLSVDFKNQFSTIRTAEKAIAFYSVFAKTDYQKAPLNVQLESLDALKHAQNLLDHRQDFRFSLLLPKHRKIMMELEQNIAQLYERALNDLLFPQIIQQLVTYLQDESKKPIFHYQALRNYLMLMNINQFAPREIKIHLQKFFRWTYPADIAAKLTEQVAELFKKEHPGFPSDDQVIRQTRKRLKQLTSSERAQLILNDHIAPQPLILNLNNNTAAASILTYIHPNTTISSFYTAVTFHRLYQGLMKQATEEAIQGNWIFGPLSRSANDPSQEISALFQKISDQYLNSYTNEWISFLENIQLIHFIQLDSLAEAVDLLSQDRSPFVQLIELIQSNLVPPILTKDERLKALAILSQQKSDGRPSIEDMTDRLKQLSFYLSEVHPSKSNPQKVFELTRLRMRNQGQNDPLSQLFQSSQLYPEPLKSWLYQIAVNTWQLMLYQTQCYIESLWQDILVQYQAQLESHFPFALYSHQEVDLDRFTYFFAPGGLLDRFFITYLAPFVENRESNWTFKSLDGNGLKGASQTLDFFQQVYQLQQIYFPEMAKRPLVSFTLQPMYVEGDVQQIVMMIGTQKMIYQPNRPLSSETFFWPDYAQSDLLQIRFIGKHGKEVSLTENGPWAWLKLLQEAGIHYDDASQQYVAQFSQGPYSMVVRLKTRLHQNPFLLERFSNLVFPKTL